MTDVLLVIDLQNDYFPEGKFPLWHSNEVARNIVELIKLAQVKNMPIVHIQHITYHPEGGFFVDGTHGAQIHADIIDAAPDAPVVIKQYADAFYQTELTDVLTKLNASKLYICGMMTQNCVTHTALSKSAEQYELAVVADCCTTVSEILHQIAIFAMSTRVQIVNKADF